MYSIPYNKKINPWLLRLILINCLVCALAIFFLATKHDTTLLGDPYYEDHISVPQRAFVPWLATLTTIPLTLILGWQLCSKK